MPTQISTPYGDVRYIQHNGSDAMIVKAAALPVVREDAPRTEIATTLRNLVLGGHYSAFMHSHVTLEFTAPGIALTPLAKFSREARLAIYPYSHSLTWRQEGPPVEAFYIPAYGSWRVADGLVAKELPASAQEVATRTLKEIIAATEKSFYTLVNLGVDPELAELVLPVNSLMHRFWLTGSVLAWHNIFVARIDGWAPVEAQELLKAALELIAPLYPETMRALRMKSERSE